ncbi:MAG: cytochrome c3 family protein, partial [Nitrospiria bacterium]
MQGKKIPILFLAVGLFVLGLGGLIVAADAFFFPSPYMPEQPIAFSHVTHSEKNEMECQYCHIYAARSSVAGVPSLQKCIGCHEMITLDHPEVQKLLDYWDQRKPIPWAKV